MLNKMGATLILTVGAVMCAHADSLISLNDPVTLHGSFPTFSAVCGPDAQPAASTIDNGVFQPEETCYQQGIHWQGSTRGDATHSISISFGGTFAIDGAIVQADDNDTYALEYLGTDHLYHPWWSIPEISSFGLVTRMMTLPPVDALGVEIFATGGDGLYAVSQMEVFGNPSPVPEPRAIGILGAGLLGIVVLVNRRRRLPQPKIALSAASCWIADGAFRPAIDRNRRLCGARTPILWRAE